ncbi:MAG: hypothetical protein NVSMB44_37580 [Ktedonobacteraceae bacterium]
MSRRILFIDDDESRQWLLHKLPHDTHNTICKVDLTTGGPDVLEYAGRCVCDALLPTVTLLWMNGQHVQAMQECTMHAFPSIIALNQIVAAPWQADRMGVSNSLIKNFNCASPPSIRSTV